MQHLKCSWRDVQEMPDRFVEYVIGEMKAESERTKVQQAVARRKK